VIQRGHKAIQRGHKAIQRGHKAIQRGHKAIQRGHQAIQRGHQAIQRGHQAIQRGHQVIQSINSNLPCLQQSSLVQIVNLISLGVLSGWISKQWRDQCYPTIFLFKHPVSRQCLAKLRCCALSCVFLEDTDYSFSVCLAALFLGKVFPSYCCLGSIAFTTGLDLLPPLVLYLFQASVVGS
jgi:hypothetical protein